MSDADFIYGLLAPGTWVEERYQIGELIGKGGSGLIFQALDTTNGQPVALKTLNADLLSHPSAVTRYHREAKAAEASGIPISARCRMSDSFQMDDLFSSWNY